MTALVAASGARIPLALERWCSDVDDVEWAQLAVLQDPVLDIGCGPGRVPAALAAAGRPALGIDVSAGAVREARARGASALCRSVFAPVPGEGRWGAAVLLDGNIGIGGNPAALLRRVASLLRPGGDALVEVDEPGRPTERVAVRLEGRRGRPSAWFPWAVVAADGFVALAVAAGFEPPTVVVEGDRWFASTRRR